MKKYSAEKGPYVAMFEKYPLSNPFRNPPSFQSCRNPWEYDIVFQPTKYFSRQSISALKIAWDARGQSAVLTWIGPLYNRPTTAFDAA